MLYYIYVILYIYVIIYIHVYYIYTGFMVSWFDPEEAANICDSFLHDFTLRLSHPKTSHKTGGCPTRCLPLSLLRQSNSNGKMINKWSINDRFSLTMFDRDSCSGVNKVEETTSCHRWLVSTYPERDLDAEKIEQKVYTV